jgi:allantoinase
MGYTNAMTATRNGTVIRNGTVVTPAGELRADIRIADGRIAEVAPDLADAEHELDATGLHIFPGVVDAHVHFNDPGRADWEGAATGSRALAAGGGTCFVDMPLNAHPPTVDADALRAKVAALSGRSAADFALWGGLVPGNAEHLAELAALGVVGFKAFMAPSGIDDFELADHETLRVGMARAAELGLPVGVHAESPDRLLPPQGSGWLDWARSRPVESELAAIEEALQLAAETGCALHVVHVSTARGVRLVVEARARGVDATCETCPHYLLLCEDDLDALGPLGKCAPPIRSAAEREELWAELRRGAIDLVASDHSPAPPSLKEGDDAFAVWGGISGCQSLLPSLLGRVEPVTAARLTAAAPAERFGLAGKGRIEPGGDADLALVRFGEWTLERGELEDRHRHNPYVGRAFGGRIVRTLLRGEDARQGVARGRLITRT